jgi:RHS repeat-associated protein
MQFTYRFFAVALLLIISSISALGQLPTPYDGFTPSSLQPGTGPASMPIDNFVQINLATGSLSLRLPYLTIGGKGKAGYTIYLTIDNNFTIDHEQYIINCAPECIFGDRYYVRQNYFWADRIPGFSPGFMAARHAGRDIGTGCQEARTLFDQTLTRLTFVSNDFTEHEFVDATYSGQVKNANDCIHGVNRGTIWVTRDGTSATFISDQPISDRVSNWASVSYPSGILKWQDGTTYRIINGNVHEIRDVNGNKISLQYSNNAVTQITDSSGRVITTAGGSINFKGFGGANRSISFSSADPQLRPDYSAYHTHSSAFPSIPDLQGPETPIIRSGPTRITFPDGRFYRFYYNPYGELARVDLPTGGKVEFDHDGGYGTYIPGGVVSAGSGVFRVVKEQRVYKSKDDIVPVERVLFNRADGPEPMIVDRVDPTSPATILARTKHYFYGDPRNNRGSNVDPITYSPWNDNLEYKTEYFAAGGTNLLRTVDRVFNLRTTINGTNFDPRLTSETLTLNDGNLVSRRTFSYDSYNNQTEVSEYDFGVGAPGPLLRRTQTTYLTNNPYQDNVNYATDLNIHIRNLPTLVSIYDGSGTEFSRTYFDYDRYNPHQLQDCPNIVQHDGGYNTSYGTRGNQTLVTRLITINPARPIYLHNQYNIAGNVVRIVDPRGNPTILDYSDRFGSPSGEARSNTPPSELGGQLSYAFPTQVTNAIGHTTYAKYDYHLGKLVDAEDQNEVVTSFSYDDPLDRRTQVVHASNIASLKNQTTYIYNDVARTITTTSDRDTFNDNLLTSISYSDGLGRPWRSASDEGVTWAIADKQFDALGRVSQVSNPYRAADPDSAVAPAGGWTKTLYDGLDRVVDVQSPDGAHVTTQYSGRRVTVIDQAGKIRSTETDPLGRLIKVTEAPSVLNYITSYSYDANGNLLEVTQGSQRRTYAYNSASQLISATNPESGTITYNYDQGGNLIEMTDARGVKATMTYDALNRLISKAYSGTTQEGTESANLTKPVFQFYDDYSTLPSGAPSWPDTPSKGRLIGVTYGTGSDGTYHQYDDAGRIVTNHQRMGSSNYVTRYTYNLADAVLTEKRRNARDDNDIMRTRSIYDPAGRLKQMMASFTPFISESILVKDISYTPFGALQSETYGNGLIHSMGYNNRLQTTEIRLGTLNNLESIFGIYNIYGTAQNPNVQDPDITLLAQNNGNIARTKYFISGTLQYTQTFLYDRLNRLEQAVEYNNGNYTDAERAWYKTCEYDRWGNRGIKTASTSDNLDGGNTALQLADFSGANNRIIRAGYLYDSAGNLIVEPRKTYTYDGANRLVKAVVDGVMSEYVYDGFGLRVMKIVGGVGTRFEYDAVGNLISERKASNNELTKGYFYRNGQLIAITEDGTTHKFATSDHLGSARAWTDRFGNLIERRDFSPYGQALPAGVGIRSSSLGYGGDSARQKFTGKEKDDETGLYFFGARYYADVQGRFTSPDIPFAGQDEINPQTWNLYAYTSNNPLNRVDPDGRRWFYKQEGNQITDIIWVDPNADGSYTGPEGYTAFVPTKEKPVLEVYAPDGTTVTLFSELKNGAPWFRTLATGMVKDTTWDIVFLVLPAKICLNCIRATAAALWAKYLLKRGAQDAAENIGGITVAQAARLQELLSAIPGVKKVYAFGSRTKRTWTTESDLDIALIGQVNVHNPQVIRAVREAQDYAKSIGIGFGKPGGHRSLDIHVHDSLEEMAKSFKNSPNFDPAKGVPKAVPLK